MFSASQINGGARVFGAGLTPKYGAGPFAGSLFAHRIENRREARAGDIAAGAGNSA